MKKCGKDIFDLREGTAQLERFLKNLDPDSVKLNDLGIEEWMRFARNFAMHVNFFDINDSTVPAGDWTNFFVEEEGIKTFVDELGSRSDIPPHLALFVSFLKLLELTQKRFNKLTARHLDFFYSEILKFQRSGIEPDKVRVIFELAKNASSVKIPAGTALGAGKDKDGKKLVYKTTEEIVVNKAKVSQLKSVYNDTGNSKLVAAEVANSFDGKGAAFPGKDVKWWPFGYTVDDVKDPDYPPLPAAKAGFALASTIFDLKEGERNVMISVTFKKPLRSVSWNVLKKSIEIYCSGEKGWAGPFEVKEKITGDTEFTSGINSGERKLMLTFTIPADEDPVTGYDKKIHEEHFDIDKPVCRVLLKTDTKEGYDLYSLLLGRQVEKIEVKVDVKGVKDLQLENDIGKLNSEKPFYPFGTIPVKGSNFYVNSPELFKKNWTELNLRLGWLNTPYSFKTLYYAYRDSNRYNISQIGFLASLGTYVVTASKTASKTGDTSTTAVPEKGSTDVSAGETTKGSQLFNLIGNYAMVAANAAEQPAVSEYNPEEKDLIVWGDSYFKAAVQVKNGKQWQVTQSSVVLFKKEDKEFVTEVDVKNSNFKADSYGSVRLTLNQSFLHEMYPRIYALAMSSEEKKVTIPNEPYTPFAGSVTLDYKAQTMFNPEQPSSSEGDDLVLFHEHPFGQSNEDPELKNKLEFLSKGEKQTALLASYPKGGELYIGLENAQPQQQVSLLIQVLEGSENPLAGSFTENEKTEWSVLCSNRWLPLSSDDMICDRTDNFLKSGIVKFNIPQYSTADNSVLPSGLIWVRVRMNKRFDAVCKAIGIEAQAAEAEFENNDNETSHLEKGLEAKTISKLVTGISGVKKVSQPYSSYGGKPGETSDKFYRRVSERLRHKNRAVSVWDYEHLILQQYPEIYKVKCLNHTKVETVDGSKKFNYLSPGNITIVVIPDIVNKNVFDIYQPRVSKSVLNSIQRFVNGLNSMHVNASVINPGYEEVTVMLKVKFHKGFDETYYKKVLNNDITKLLSPWAFESSAAINFGTTLHRSKVINYIEELEYIDFVEDVRLLLNDEVSITKVDPSGPASVLVSAKEHSITLVDSSYKH